MKLEIKHLAPYLPYGLKVQHTTFVEFGKTIERIQTLECLSDECATFPSGMDYYFDDENECEIKPLLRPLSDLTKEIEHNGERFVPIEKLKEMYGMTILMSNNKSNEPVAPLKLEPYIIIQQLFEWHFDVFGLINSGLAIDLNTIQK
jgi:hypothetical protein